MASFTGVGDSVELLVPARGETVDIDISGTYDMTIAFQREVGAPGSGAFVTLQEFSTANATVAEKYVTKSFNEKLRLIVTVDTSGTATATLADGSDLSVKTIRDSVGNVIAEYKQSGLVVTDALTTGGTAVGAAPVEVTAATTLTAADHAGRTIVFNDADGATVTLPAATGTGNVYKFFVSVTVTSNSDIIQVANATDEFLGTLYQIDTDTGDAIAAYPCLDGDGFDTVTLNGTTTGGLMGDFIEIEDVASGKFAIRGTVMGTGTVATPVSAAVS